MSTEIPNALKSLERYASYSYGLVADRDGSWVRLSDVGQALQPEPGEVVVRDGAALIVAERERQVAEEGFSAVHDDTHRDRSLLAAARCYARLELGSGWGIPDEWPWEDEAWQPRDNISCLVKAGALIAAEIDRLERERSRRSALEESS